MTAPVDLYLGIPAGGGVVAQECLHTVLALVHHFQKLQWRLHLVTRADGLVTRPRNAFASAVVRNERFTHLLMLDADVAIDPVAIERMIRFDRDLVGAGVPLRQVRWDSVRQYLDAVPDATAAELQAVSHRFAAVFEPPGGSRQPVSGFLPARLIGSAAMLITRNALLRVVDAGQVSEFRSGGHADDGVESGWTFFDPFVETDGTYLSEDYAFCSRLRRAGGEVWVDLESTTQHVGPISVAGDIGATLRAGGRAAANRAAPA